MKRSRLRERTILDMSIPPRGSSMKLTPDQASAGIRLIVMPSPGYERVDKNLRPADILGVRGRSDDQRALPSCGTPLEESRNPFLETSPPRELVNLGSLHGDKAGLVIGRHGGNLLLWLLKQHRLPGGVVRFGRGLWGFGDPGSLRMVSNGAGTQIGDAGGVDRENLAVEEAKGHGGDGDGAA